MSVATQLAYMLALLAVGAGLRAVGILTERRRDRLTAVAFYVALPALVFSSTVNRSLSDVLVWRLFVGVTVVLVAVAGIGWLVHRDHADPSRRGVAVVQSYHCNLGFLGVPFVAATFGGVTAGKASVILGIGSLVQVTLTVLLLTSITSAEADVTQELRSVARNPVLVALVLGLVGGAVGVDLPNLAQESLGLLGSLALPIALPAVGASLSSEGGLVDPPTVGAVAAVKLLVMPLLALLVFVGLDAAPTTLRAGVLMLAMPTAVSTYIYSSELGGDGDLASATVLTTTVVAVATLFGVVALLGLVTP
ncbi:AEC family transporter [Haloarchaeobius amylolyticus]|uniref:AEC family transporter n=1 Tax=Haloarchaeobius amylolyticus TaxID=1198296 RepID=UPI0022710541|nr:AEC family transporter [Haloarchaeobius amylolyticus]